MHVQLLVCCRLTVLIVYVLRTHPEVLVDRKNNPEPWNRVQQHENIKVSLAFLRKIYSFLNGLSSSLMSNQNSMKRAKTPSVLLSKTISWYHQFFE